MAIMGKADLHIHTTYSYDSSVTVPAVLEWAVTTAGLDVVAITDHDAFGGAEEGLRRAPEFGIEVIPGCEITTKDGHLLSLFIDHPVAKGLSMHETILRVGEQGGVCIAAHPMAFMVHGASQETIWEILSDPDARKVLIGIETINTGLFFQASNQKTAELNETVHLSPTGSSDSHVVWTIGLGYTQFPGRSAQDLRQALYEKTTTAHCLLEKHSPGYWASHVFHRMLREMGWVTWMPEPNSDFVLRRLAEVQG
jgi:predicted metal-dependent phosphoesterase TrpH